MLNSYRPFQKTLEYFRNHGEYSLTDDEIMKIVEIFSYIQHKTNAGEDITEVGSPETIEERKATCSKCIHYNPENDRCKLCGCVINEKVIKPGEKCPRQLWGFDVRSFKDLFLEISKEIEEILRDRGTITIEQNAERAKEQFERGEEIE